MKQHTNPIEIKAVIYTEGNYSIAYAIDHNKGWAGYALLRGKDVLIFSLNIERIFDVATPLARSGNKSKDVDLIDPKQARLKYTYFKEKNCRGSTYLSGFFYRNKD